MKQYIKNGKIYNEPICINHRNGTTTYTNDESIILKNGYKKYEVVIPEPTMEEVITQSINNINKETDEKILNEFTFRNEEFYLTSENQMNFANMYIAKEYLTYPQQVKTKNGFIELQSAEEITEFYLSGISFVKACLEEGWIKKAQAEEQIRNDYSNLEHESETELEN